MCKHSALVVVGVSAVLSLGSLTIAAVAQESSSDANATEAWRTLDEDFRRAVVAEILVRRGIDSSDQDPESLIVSAEDIAEALKVSCELSGACADQSGRATLGANLQTFPDYDEAEGLRNAEAILRKKMGYED